jgi:hypothetical protein
MIWAGASFLSLAHKGLCGSVKGFGVACGCESGSGFRIR